MFCNVHEKSKCLKHLSQNVSSSLQSFSTWKSQISGLMSHVTYTAALNQSELHLNMFGIKTDMTISWSPILFSYFLFLVLWCRI